MAKSNLKKLLLTSCFSAILFLSCEKEFLEEEHSNHESNIKKTKVNFDDFKENQKAFDVFKKLNLTDSKSANKNSDVQNSNSYDFEINFNNGIHLNYHNLESYTFPIRRNVDNGLLENIVISEHTDGKYYAKLLKYNLTSHERIDIANGEFKGTQNPIVTEVLGEYAFGNQIQSDCGYITITIITACVNGHTSRSECNLTGAAAPQTQTFTIAADCDGGGGGGGTGDGSGGYYGDPFYGGGGSGGGGYITPDFPNDNTPTDLYEDGISEPVLDIGDGTTYQDSNVIKLNSITNNNVVKPKMTDLKNRVTDTKEHGYEFTTSSNDILVPSNLLIGGLDGVQFPAMQVNTKVRVHVHHNELEPIPSIQDVVGFATMYKDKVNLNATDANEIISIIISQNVNYAMRVSDPVKLQAFLNDYNDPDLTNEKTGETYADAIDDLFNNIPKLANAACGGTCGDTQYDALLEMYFISAFKKLDCGISMYYAVPTTTSNPNYTWTTLN